MRVKLTNGGYTEVSEDINPQLLSYKWYKNATGYVVANAYRNGKRVTLYLHKEALFNPKTAVDHIDRNKLNNTFENLRFASNSQNGINKDKYKTNKTGYKGVSFKNNRYRAQITINNVHKHLGSFLTAEEAAKAYDVVAKEVFGEFAYLNFPVDFQRNQRNVFSMKIKTPWSEILVRVVAWTAIVAGTYFLITDKGYADDYVDASLGMFHNGTPSPANVKYGQVGHLTDLGFGFINDASLGGWVQTPVGDGRVGSAFISDQLGIEINNGLVIRAETGPSMISATDSYLGGHFQFHETLYVGLKDATYGTTIGFAYQHFSSAGLEMPNQGRDFGGLLVSLPF